MFVYPWDMDGRADTFWEEYRRLGCNTIAVNTCYHHISIIDTALMRVYERRQAGPSFAIHPERYGRIRPQVQADLTGTFLQLREACAQAGMTYRSWNVNLHSSAIGQDYPDACVENVWGDRYSYTLCLNHPDVLEYDLALLTDIIDTLDPDSFIMEAVSWIPAFHGKHHEFSLVHITPAIRYLLTLCFCPHCIQAAQAEGIDALAVRETVRTLLQGLLARELTFGDNEQTQLTHLLIEYPELYAYQQFRTRSVTRFVQATAQLVHQSGKRYEYIPSSTPFEVNSTLFEGYSFRALTGVPDRYVPLVYDPKERCSTVLGNIRLFDHHTPVAAGLNLSRVRYTGQGDFLQRIQDGVDCGISAFYLYNYGTAPRECLDWIAQGAGLVLGSEGNK